MKNLMKLVNSRALRFNFTVKYIDYFLTLNNAFFKKEILKI